MNITLVNTFDIKGGAARAAYRLHRGFRNLGESSTMLVRHKSSEDSSVMSVEIANTEATEKLLYPFTVIQNQYLYSNRTDISNTLFSLPYPGLDISTVPVIREAQLINLHWIAFYQSPVTLHKLFETGKPVVWTLHDQWAFTGGCHYSADCSKYKTDCSACPQLADNPFNLPSEILKDKKDLFSGANLTIVSPSNWLANCAKESSIFKGLRVEVIPNSLETDIFTPTPKFEAKNRMGLEKEDITILFGAESGREKRKGFKEFVSAIHYCLKDSTFKELSAKGKIKLLCFGRWIEGLENTGLPVISLGYLLSDDKISEAYSAAEFFVLPSLEDNLPNTMLESLSCGTPVVSFAAGGIPDVVIDHETGRLSSPADAQALGNSILYMVKNPENRIRMGLTGRKMMTEKYSLEIQAKEYLTLYNELVSKRSENTQMDSSLMSNGDMHNYQVSIISDIGLHFKDIYKYVLEKSLKKYAHVAQK